MQHATDPLEGFEYGATLIALAEIEHTGTQARGLGHGDVAVKAANARVALLAYVGAVRAIYNAEEGRS